MKERIRWGDDVKVVVCILVVLGMCIVTFVIGYMACYAILAWISNREIGSFMDYLAKYTMPIFLMHTMFAAPVRAVLIKLGIVNAFIHFSAGLIMSVVGPILAAMIMKKLKYPEFLLYSGKFLKDRRKVVL